MVNPACKVACIEEHRRTHDSLVYPTPPRVSWEPLRPHSRDDRLWQPAPVSRLWYNAGGRVPASCSSVPHCSVHCDAPQLREGMKVSLATGQMLCRRRYCSPPTAHTHTQIYPTICDALHSLWPWGGPVDHRGFCVSCTVKLARGSL